MPDSYRIRYDKAVTPNEDYPDGMSKGAEFDVEGKAGVSRYHPAATIVGTINPDGTVSPYDEPKADAAPEPKAESKKGA